MKILAPGKLILSGEHAVVYGKPALAMAVNRYAITTTSSQRLPFVSFKLADLAYERRLDLMNLRQLKERIKRKYDRFIAGDFKIRDVLQKPVELAQYAFTLIYEALNIKLNQGIQIHVSSEIPMGCGMGSSAATILSVVHAVAHHLESPLPSDLLFRLGLEAENMQHGYSSGLDLQVSLQGGCLYLKDGQVHSRAIPQAHFYLVNTGTPLSTTGECVAEVAAQFRGSAIWEEFASVTEAMDVALQQNQHSQIKQAISQNHQLLTTIGVVPRPVVAFIDEIEQSGGAAKICGAGASSGDQAGVILVVAEDELYLKKMCQHYGYTILPIAGEMRGVHVG